MEWTPPLSCAEGEKNLERGARAGLAAFDSAGNERAGRQSRSVTTGSGVRGSATPVTAERAHRDVPSGAGGSGLRASRRRGAPGRAETRRLGPRTLRWRCKSMRGAHRPVYGREAAPGKTARVRPRGQGQGRSCETNAAATRGRETLQDTSTTREAPRRVTGGAGRTQRGARGDGLGRPRRRRRLRSLASLLATTVAGRGARTAASAAGCVARPGFGWACLGRLRPPGTRQPRLHKPLMRTSGSRTTAPPGGTARRSFRARETDPEAPAGPPAGASCIPEAWSGEPMPSPSGLRFHINLWALPGVELARPVEVLVPWLRCRVTRRSPLRLAPRPRDH